jgi:hypothetical protein
LRLNCKASKFGGRRYRERAAIRSGSAGLDFQKGSLRFRFPVVSFQTVHGWRPARQRMGEEKLKALLQESLAVATRTEAMKPSDLARVVIDTTVQPKAVALSG